MPATIAEQLVRDYLATRTIPAKPVLKRAGPALVIACLEHVANPVADQSRIDLLLEPACGAVPAPTEPELRRIVQLTTATIARIPPFGLSLVLAYLEKADLTPGLCDDLRALRASTPKGSLFFTQAGDQLFRQRMALLEWLDLSDPIEPDRCWSERIRHDLRHMKPGPFHHWRDIFKSMRADGISRLKPKSEAEARERLDALGRDEFTQRIRHWFYPFSQPEPVPLSIAGSHILKGLLQYCALAPDSAILEAALWLVVARWKQKKNVDKVMVALLGLLETMPPQDAWQPLLLLQETWGLPGGQIESLLTSIAQSLGISEEELRRQRLIAPKPPSLPDIHFKAAQVALELMGPRFAAFQPAAEAGDATVTGRLDSYRVSLSTGRITRRSDGAVLMLDPSRLPSELQPFIDVEIRMEPDPARSGARQVWQAALGEQPEVPESTGLRQIYLRIAMLREDDVYGSAFVVLDDM